VELNYLSLEKCQDFQKSLRKDSLVETAAKIKEFDKSLENLQAMKEQRKEIKRLRREVKKQYKKGNKNYVVPTCRVSVEQSSDPKSGSIIEYKSEISPLTEKEISKIAQTMYLANREVNNVISSTKSNSDLNSDIKEADKEVNAFVKQLVGLANLKGLAEYYLETDKYFKNKMQEIKKCADSFTQARKQQLHQEHEEFKKAKALGVHAVIKYKTNKILARQEARKIQNDLKASLQHQQNQAKQFIDMSYSMNHYKPKTEQDKLKIGTQNYLHTKRCVAMLDFGIMRLKQIREYLKKRRRKPAEDLFDKTDFSEVLKLISIPPNGLLLSSLLTHGNEFLGNDILICTTYIEEFQKQKDWYNKQQQSAVGKIYDAHV
jgi:hypothetical protein